MISRKDAKTRKDPKTRKEKQPPCQSLPGQRVTLPLLKGTGKPGPACPNTETPYDFIIPGSAKRQRVPVTLIRPV